MMIGQIGATMLIAKWVIIILMVRCLLIILAVMSLLIIPTANKIDNYHYSAMQYDAYGNVVVNYPYELFNNPRSNELDNDDYRGELRPLQEPIARNRTSVKYLE